MALAVRINPVGATIVLVDAISGVQYSMGIEDIRMRSRNNDEVEIETEVPTDLRRSVYKTSLGEVEIDGSTPANSTDAINAFGAVVASAAPGGGSGGDASAANQLTQIGLETSIKENTGDTVTELVDANTRLQEIADNTDQLESLVADGAKESTAQQNEINTAAIDDNTNDLEGNTAITQETPSCVRVSIAGSIAAGARSVYVENIGASNGSFLGITLEPGRYRAVAASRLNTLASMPYNGSGTILEIIETR